MGKELSDALAQLGASWTGFLQHVQLAKCHSRVPLLESVRIPNPLLDRLLPTLLFIQLMSLLDEALEEERAKTSLRFPRGSRPDLYHRIEILKHELKSPEDLHTLRKRRRDLAHSPAAFVAWEDLDHAIDVVERELRRFGVIGARPRYEFFAERSGVKESDDPECLFEFDYEYGLKRDGEVVLGVRWKKRVARGS